MIPDRLRDLLRAVTLPVRLLCTALAVLLIVPPLADRLAAAFLLSPVAARCLAAVPVVLALYGVFTGLAVLYRRLLARNQQPVSEEEIRMLVDMGEEKGSIQSGEKELIENIFEFNNMNAEDVMIHRTDVSMLWADDTDDEIVRTIEETGLSRYPVYEEDADDIIGILNSRDYFLNARHPDPKPLRQLLRPAYFVPESVRTDVLFRDMQAKKIHLAIVVDEYGGTSGIITMEDLLEEIVGNIYDEFDPLAEQEIIDLGDGNWRIAGSADLDEVAEALGLDLDQGEEEYDTLGGLVFAQLSVIPEDGSHPEVDACGLHIKVEQLADRRVEWALVRRSTEDPATNET
ncbi:MAG: hemolysin family protein, partial [Pseudoflavonifractor sp.]